jgi:RES domain-containing protein
VTNLPRGWNNPNDHSLAAAIGDAWLDSGDSLALRVPSAVLPLERNLVVNVQHPLVGEVTTAEPQAFDFDPRLR